MCVGASIMIFSPDMTIDMRKRWNADEKRQYTHVSCGPRRLEATILVSLPAPVIVYGWHRLKKRIYKLCFAR